MNYIISSKNRFMHFFYSPIHGLCFKEKKQGKWSESETLAKNAKDGFSVFCDENGFLHILFTDNSGAIMYITKKDDGFKTYTLSSGNPEISPLVFSICKVGNIINFFYSAEYKNSYILIHCVLGQNAKPEIIDTLYYACNSYSVNNGKIYYTNQDKILGFRTFHDSSPSAFSKISTDATECYSSTFDNTEYVIYKKGDFLIFNGNEIFSDASCKNPLIQSSENRLTIQWKSNGFVRYLTSFNNGATWSSPMRFIGSNAHISKFFVQEQSSAYMCFGQDSKLDPILYGKSNLFFLL